MNRDEQANGVSYRWTLAFAAVAALLAGVQRLAPHPSNFFMIGALGLWAGARLRPWQALSLPVLVWGLTESYWWLKGWPIFNPFVGCSFLAYGLLGLLLRNRRSVLRVGSVCVLGSIQFFVLTNFSVWLSSCIDPVQAPEGKAFFWQMQGSPYPEGQVRYAANAEGLLACYAMAIPFYGQDAAGRPIAEPFGFLGNILAGDLFFTALLFGAYATVLRLARRRALAWRKLP